MWVRDATISDVPEILAFIRAKAQFDRGLGALQGDIETSEELIGRHLFGPSPFAWALLAGDAASATGFAFYYFCFSSFRGRPSMWLDDLYVHAADRRHGTGQRLMGRLGEIATATDCTHIAWLASASNAVGMNFYRKLGATVVQQIEDAVTLRIVPSALVALIGRHQSAANSNFEPR